MALKRYSPQTDNRCSSCTSIRSPEETFARPLDYSFMELTDPTGVLDDPTETTPEKDQFEKWRKLLYGDRKDSTEAEEEISVDEDIRTRSNALRFSNNAIADWSGFERVVGEVIVDPLQVEWVDMSFNLLTTIDGILAGTCPKVKVLYLHGNLIANIDEVEKLSQLPYLTTLTLHGNPCAETTPLFRHTIIAKLPHLKKLDFTPISNDDRLKALSTIKKKKKGKKKY